MKYTAIKNQGLTLVEMLVVMVVLAILVSLVVGVSGYVTARANREATQLTQSVLIMAVEKYRDIKGDPPNITEDIEASHDRRSHLLYLMLTGDETQEPDENVRKEIAKKVGDILRQLPADAIAVIKIEDEDKHVITDGWGKPMDYHKDKGIGGVPVFISPGPDGNIDTKADNVRSDGRANK